MGCLVGFQTPFHPNRDWQQKSPDSLVQCGDFSMPIGSMVAWYIYLHGWLIFMVNVVKYTIHGYFGMEISINLFQLVTLCQTFRTSQFE